ncbi:MAG: type II secretion system F family protein [Actinomycetota bacterium]
MRWALAALAAGLLAVAAASVGAAAQAPEELRIEAVDARSFPTVAVLVTPPPTLYGVVPDTVTLMENGSRRPTTARLLAQEPLEVLLVVDTSGSMRGAALDAAKQAAAGFVEALPPTTRTAVLGFAAAPALISAFSDDPAAALAALGALQAAGETALYDAVVAALEVFDPGVRGRPFIVLLSDGGDTVSTASLADAAARLEASEVGFYAVELQTEESDRVSLEALTGVSAGRVVSAEDPTALATVYEQIASELVNQLVVTYSSPRGGDVDLAITIEHQGVSASGTASVTLPTTGVTTTTITPSATTTRPAQGEPAGPTTPPAPPTPFLASGPGPFGASWVLPVGLTAFFLAALLVFGLALVPVDRPRSQLATAPERFAPSGGWLTRLADRAKWGAEAALRWGGRQSTLGRALDGAGVRLSAGEFMVLSVSSGLIGMALGALLFRLIGARILGALALIVPRLAVTHRQQKRRQAFADQLDGTLQLLAGSLRAGYGLLQSVNTASAEAAQPTGEEFGRILVETRLGRDLVASLTALAERMDSQDFRWVAQAIDIQRSVGGDLAEILDTVSQTIRERNQIRRQVKALSAEGRISAYILIVIPFAIAGFIVIAAPDFLAPLVETPAGKIAVVVGAVLMLIGIIWIRRLIRLRF